MQLFRRTLPITIWLFSPSRTIGAPFCNSEAFDFSESAMVQWMTLKSLSVFSVIYEALKTSLLMLVTIPETSRRSFLYLLSAWISFASYCAYSSCAVIFMVALGVSTCWLETVSGGWLELLLWSLFIQFIKTDMKRTTKNMNQPRLPQLYCPPLKSAPQCLHFLAPTLISSRHSGHCVICPDSLVSAIIWNLGNKKGRLIHSRHNHFTFPKKAEKRE